MPYSKKYATRWITILKHVKTYDEVIDSKVTMMKE